jgi:ribosomal-protein-alanine N-acetyltransferase
LCLAGMEWARGVGAWAMELEVRASSEAARGLYRALGFVEQGRRRGYYREPVEDAVLMGVGLQGERSRE